MYDDIRELLEFINQSTSPWHTAEASARLLKQAGFEELVWGDSWKIEEGKGYYTKVFGSTLLAFRKGKARDNNQGPELRIAAAHTDFPGFRLKPRASMLAEGYGILNVESYGGLILSTWQDRPLSMAGKIVLKGEGPFSPDVRLIDFGRPLLTIPSLAIHMNKKVNDGIALNKQKDMLPLAAVFGKNADAEYMNSFLAHELGCFKEDILSYELNLYPYEGGCQLGLAGEMVSAGRLDNITSVMACLKGMINSKAAGLQVIALFDNEEIGSRTKQGADSGILLMLLKRIYAASGIAEEILIRDIADGFMLSVDVAHGVHPDYLSKSDPTNKPVLGGGAVLKQAAVQSYAGDAEAVSIVSSICQENGIPYQQFVNRSDMPGGATLGSIASSLVPMRTMDIGLPILAMHSARETMGSADQSALNRLIEAFLR